MLDVARNAVVRRCAAPPLFDVPARRFSLYRRNRYYDAASGRFTQEDPIGLAGGLNLYGYANGDPVNFSDPFGLCGQEERGNCTQSDVGPSEISQGQGCNLSCREEKDWAKGTSVPLAADPIFNALTLGAGSAEGAVAADATAAVGGRVGPKFVGNAISGFTKHGIDQVINRGVSPSALLNAARTGATRGPLIDQFGRESLRILGEAAEFAINLLGKVTTAWPK